MTVTRFFLALFLLPSTLLLPVGASAQELQPAAYWPAPTGLNVLTLANNLNWGDVTFDPALPVEDAGATVNTTVAAYTRTLAFFGRSANVAFQLPIVKGRVDGVYRGTPTEVDRFGLADPRVQFTANLFGAPAMSLADFAAFRRRTVVGAGVTLMVPLGQYDTSRIINLGSNRWAVKPELGLSQVFGKWVLEAMAGVWLFTDNTDFAGGVTREQDPIGSGQLHVRYRASPTFWVSGNANFYTGGRTTVSGERNLDLQRNSRIGLTSAWSIDTHHSIRLSVSRGAWTSIGADFASVGVGYNFAWIG